MATSSLPDHYRVLGVSVYASSDEIRRAFRRLAHRYHPDKLQQASEENETFSAILEAYQVLADSDSRRKYNRTFYGKSFQEERLDAAGLLEKIRLFQVQVQAADPYRYDEEALSFHFHLLLQHTDELQQSTTIDPIQCSRIADALLPALERLPAREWQSAGARLVSLSRDNPVLAAKIARQVRWLPVWRSNRLPIGIALLITLLLGCLFFWGVAH